MKVLMFGWELPPLYAGGIGMVCYDLMKELCSQGIEIFYMMPFGPNGFSSDATKNIIIAENLIPQIRNVSVHLIDAGFSAYQSPEEYKKTFETQLKGLQTTPGKVRKNLYGKDLFLEVDLFAKRAFEIAKHLDFDIIHAHDWMTFPAAIAAADATGKPLIVHMHNTIYDRYLGNASSIERDIEYNGMARANKIIAISQYIKNMIVSNYGIDPKKIEVIHNAPNTLLRNHQTTQPIELGDDKVVLFTGRITAQKGPEYFVLMARHVVDQRQDVKFVMAGSGDMFHKIVDLATNLNIAEKFLFTGFYNMQQAKSLYARADCFVMPSVSEPFGIVPLEAMDLGVPAIISKTSGCSEVLSHTLKVDFWDAKQMAGKVLAVLNYPILKSELGQNGKHQVNNMNWAKPAQQCKDLYHRLKNG